MKKLNSKFSIPSLIISAFLIASPCAYAQYTPGETYLTVEENTNSNNTKNTTTGSQNKITYKKYAKKSSNSDIDAIANRVKNRRRMSRNAMQTQALLKMFGMDMDANFISSFEISAKNDPTRAMTMLASKFESDIDKSMPQVFSEANLKERKQKAPTAPPTGYEKFKKKFGLDKSMETTAQELASSINKVKTQIDNINKGTVEKNAKPTAKRRRKSKVNVSDLLNKTNDYNSKYRDLNGPQKLKKKNIELESIPEITEL